MLNVGSSEGHASKLDEDLGKIGEVLAFGRSATRSRKPGGVNTSRAGS